MSADDLASVRRERAKKTIATIDRYVLTAGGPFRNVKEEVASVIEAALLAHERDVLERAARFLEHEADVPEDLGVPGHALLLAAVRHLAQRVRALSGEVKS